MTLNQFLVSNLFILVSSILVPTAWGMDEVLICPPETTKIDFVSPVTQSKKEFCGYQKNGATVKHGFEWVYDKQGKVEKKIYWEHGKEAQYTEPPKATTNEESEEAVAAIKDLLRVLVIHGKTASRGSFQVHTCDKDTMAWIKSAMTKAPVSKTYVFEAGCDVSGSFTAKFGEDFPVEFKLRNLKEFNHTKMTVKMELVKIGRMVKYKFFATSGVLSSPKTSAEFSGEYEIQIDPFTLKANFNSQIGNLVVTKVNGQPVNISRPLDFSN